MERTELQRYLNRLLEVERFKDYCPNGLQVEGRTTIRRAVFGRGRSPGSLSIVISGGLCCWLMRRACLSLRRVS